MKLAASTLALPAFDHLDLFPDLMALGIDGIEIAPANTWRDPDRVRPAEIDSVRAAAEMAGLRVVGLHALLDGRPGLDLFGDPDAQDDALETLLQRSALCRDLGGHTLILDVPWGLEPPAPDTWGAARALLERLLPCIEPHGTVLCLAPRGRGVEGAISALTCYRLANAIDHPAFGLHLGATALHENNEMGHATFCVLRGRLDHVHLDEPGYLPLGDSGRIDHVDLRRHLAAISYFGWISVVQSPPPGPPLDAMRRAIAFASRTYLPIDTR